jgi:multiple sugar transport system permease protein
MRWVKMMRNKRTIGIVYLFYILVALWVFIPVYWMVNTSLHPEGLMLSKSPPLFPIKPTYENFRFIFATAEVMRERLEKGLATYFLPTIAASLPNAIRNSMIVALSVMFINLSLAPFAAWVFQRVKFKGGFAIYLSTVLTRLIPGVAIIIPLFAIMKGLNLLDTYVALIIVHTMITFPLSMWISYNFFEGIPADIEEAAFIDGYSRFETYRKIIFPVMKPAMVAVSAFSFMISYSEFLFAFLLTTSDASRTVPVIIAAMAANPVMPRTIMAAAGIIAMIPPLIIFIILRRYIIRGLISGVVVR